MSDYDEDFENYDDEGFETEEEEQTIPQSKAGSKQPSSKAAQVQSGHNDLYRSDQNTAIVQLGPGPEPLTDSQIRARGKRLLAATRKMKSVQLQTAAMDDVFVLASLSQYELFSMGRGPYAGYTAAAIQTHDDAREEECQTDDVEYEVASCQVPDDSHHAKELTPTGKQQPRSVQRTGSKASRGSNVPASKAVVVDPQQELKLAAFMQWAGPVMTAALGKATGTSAVVTFPKQSQQQQAHNKLVDGSIHLSWPELLSQRSAAAVSLQQAPGTTHLAVAYTPTQVQQKERQEVLTDDGIVHKSCYCVWDVSRPASPVSVLRSEGLPTCCTWVPGGQYNILIAGMEEGSICVWDLDEPVGHHPREVIAQGQPAVVCRCPSYTTEAQPDVRTVAPIRAVCCTSPTTDSNTTSPCQVVALTAWGHVALYSLHVMSSYGTAAAAGDTDRGARLGSRVRLLRIMADVRLGMFALQPPDVPQPQISSYCMALLQGPPGPRYQVMVGCEACKTLRGSWLGKCPAPKSYLAVEGSPAATSTLQTAAVTCIADSPFDSQVFLVGTSAGGIALHNANSSTAVFGWPGAGTGDILAVCWSSTSPVAFAALDSASVVHWFDLSKSTTGPTCHIPVKPNDRSSNQEQVTATCMQMASFAVSGQKSAASCIVVGYNNGQVDVHKLTNELAMSSMTVEQKAQLLKQLSGVHT